MAKAKPVQVEEKTAGTKVAWRQSGTKLIFGDDDLSPNCATRQREFPVTVDVTVDRDGNLQTGLGDGCYYVAQIEIPPTEMKEVPDTPEGREDTGTESGTGTHYEPQPIDMSKVKLVLWGLDNLPAAIVERLTESEQED